MNSFCSAVSSEEITVARTARARLEIDLSALRHNIRRIAQYGDSRIMAVVKGDAYGLGGLKIAETLVTEGVAAFAVENVAEGLELRMGGITLPMMVIDGDLEDNCEVAIRHSIMPGIPHIGLLNAYQQAAQKLGTRHPVWLASNLGLNRSGYRSLTDLTEFAQRVAQCTHLDVQGLYAHLTNANLNDGVSQAQISFYFQQLDVVRNILGSHIQSNLFASHAIPRWSTQIPSDWIRPGLLLYGEEGYEASVLDNDHQLRQDIAAFRPVISLHARITEILEFPNKQAIGYGQRFYTYPGQRLATVALGFGRGYPRGTFAAQCIVNGHFVPLVGPAIMDSLQIDITGVPEASVGDWVTLIGQSGDAKISASDLARVAGIRPYELIRYLSAAHVYCG